MDKTLKIILWIIAVGGGGAILYTFQAAQSGSHYETFGLEYASVAIAVSITLIILTIILTVSTVGALIRREYKDPLKRKNFFKLLAATIAVDALVVLYGIKIFFNF